MATQYVAWGDGVWAEGVWGLDVWEFEQVDVLPSVTAGGGKGRSKGKPAPDPFIDQVREKWDAIEQAQQRRKVDTVEAQPVQIQEALPEFVPESEQTIQVAKGGAMDLAMPIAIKALQAPMVPVPLSPLVAEAARRAREADDEEALIFILSQL
jgi:hypothetical protein